MRPLSGSHFETMKPELTNLLPENRLRTLRQVYFLRLATVAVLVLSGVAIVHGVLLLPSYLFVRAQVEEREMRLETLTTTLAGAAEQEVSARVAAIGADSTYLATRAAAPKASTATQAVLSVPRDGVRLRGFSFAPQEGGAQMLVSGVASSRESLRRYEQALSDQPFVERVELPISAYAKESNIDFTITLTGSFAP